MMNSSISILAAFIAFGSCALTAKAITHLSKATIIPQNRLGCIDGLRGFLALGVFIHHYVVTYYFHLSGQWHVPPSTFYTLIGQVGVILFFMVTGFLFWHKILTSRGRVDWLKLYVSRIFRIVPLYSFVVTAVCLIVICIGGTTLRVSLLSLVKSIMTWLLFQGTPDINSFNGTGLMVARAVWTLTDEWYFYLSLPVLAALLKISGENKVLRWALIGCIAGIIILGKIPYSHVYTRIFTYFAAGALAAYLYQVEAYRAIAQKRLTSCVALLSLLLLFVIFKHGYGKFQALFITIFFISVALGNSLFGILRLPALIFLGEISYSVYLLHGLLLYICFSVVFPTFMSMTTPSIQISLAMSLVGCVLVLLSWITFSTIESPFIGIGRHIARYLGPKRS